MGCPTRGDLTADAVIDPDGDDTRTLEEPVPELPTLLAGGADKPFDVDDEFGDIMSVQVEDSLDDGELVEGMLAFCNISEDVHERLGPEVLSYLIMHYISSSACRQGLN